MIRNRSVYSKFRLPVLAALTFTLALLLFVTVAPPEAESANRCADVTAIMVNGQVVSEGVPVKVTSRTITIEVKFFNEATHYHVCEASNFSGCPWVSMPADGRITFVLSEGNGIKTIYFQAKNLGTKGKKISFQVELAQS